MRLHANGVATIVHGATIIQANKDGSIDVPADLIELAKSFGCSEAPLSDKPAPAAGNTEATDAVALPRKLALDALTALGVIVPQEATPEFLVKVLGDVLTSAPDRVKAVVDAATAPLIERAEAAEAKVDGMAKDAADAIKLANDKLAEAQAFAAATE